MASIKLIIYIQNEIHGHAYKHVYNIHIIMYIIMYHIYVCVHTLFPDYNFKILWLRFNIIHIDCIKHIKAQSYTIGYFNTVLLK